MATSGTWETSWNSGTWAGYPKKYVWGGSWSKSGTSITLYGMWIRMEMQNPSHSGWGSGTDYITVTGGGTQTRTFTWSGGNSSNTQYLDNTSFSVGTTDTSRTISCEISGEATGYTTIYFDPSGTAPTGLSVTNITNGKDNFSATVSLSGWGGLGDANSRYRELQVWTYGMNTPRRFQHQPGNSLSGTITCNNSSMGDLTIKPNTRYTIGGYATNGTYDTGSVRIADATTLPPELDAVSISSITATTAIVTFTAKGSNYDGGQYAKNVLYSLNGGAATNAGNIATSGTLSATLSGLSPKTTYTISAYNRTTAGNSAAISASFTTATALYGSVNNQAKGIKTLYGSVNGETKKINRLYGSVSGVTKRIF